jgi:hypothetical protein
VAVGILLALIVALTILSGPIVGWMSVTTEGLEDPSAYIAANALPDGG